MISLKTVVNLPTVIKASFFGSVSISGSESVTKCHGSGTLFKNYIVFVLDYNLSFLARSKVNAKFWEFHS